MTLKEEIATKVFDSIFDEDLSYWANFQEMDKRGKFDHRSMMNAVAILFEHVEQLEKVLTS